MFSVVWSGKEGNMAYNGVVMAWARCVVQAVVFLAAGAASACARQVATVADAQEIHRSCDGLDKEKRTACYDERLQGFARQGDVKRALDALQGLARLDGDVARDGHMYAHGIGIAAFKPDVDFGKTFVTCSELFHAGCYHGLIQAYFASAGTVDSGSVNGLCATVGGGPGDRWTRFQCVHGLGHGLMIHYHHNLIHSLDGCELLNSTYDRESCYGGAFMENVTAATIPHHAALAANSLQPAGHDHHAPPAGEKFVALKREDLHYPCNIVKEHMKMQCYGMQTSAILHMNGRDFAAAARTCDEATPPWRAACHQSLGRDATGHAERDIGKTRRYCMQDRSPDASFCYVGAAKAIIDWAGKPEDGMAFCTSVRGDLNRMRCYQAVGEQIGVIVADQNRRQVLCMDAPSPEREACLWGARVIPSPPALLRGT
jgi:hypothetical protein